MAGHADALTHPLDMDRHTVQSGSQMDFTVQPLDEPGTSSPPASPRKLSHFRKAGAGAAMWSGQCVYGLSGASPSISEYDVPDPISDVTPDEMPYHIRNGVVTSKSLVDAKEPTMTRNARVSAHFDSLPAARTFQGTFSARWSGMMSGFRPVIAPRPLVQSWNPNQAGAKELHPATQYKPFPPMGSLVPAYGEQKAL